MSEQVNLEAIDIGIRNFLNPDINFIDNLMVLYRELTPPTGHRTEKE
jgi:hypothetical protein